MKDSNINFNIKDPLIIMGNGLSLKNIDFNMLKNKDTFGLSNAFKYYEKNNWYPKYWGAFDEFWLRINNLDIKKFILSNKCICFLPRINESFNNVVYLPCLSKIPILKDNIPTYEVVYISSPSPLTACDIGINLGYKKIILVGIDCNFKKEYTNYFGGTIPFVYNDLDFIKLKYGVNNTDEFFDFVNKEHEQGFLKIQKAWPQVDFVNCGGELSKLNVFRRGDLKNEL